MAWLRQQGTPSPPPTSLPPRVCIGIPYTQDVTMMFAIRTLTPLLAYPLAGVEKVYQMARGIPVSLARDQIVENALKDPRVTHILWVDTDSIVSTPNNDPNQALQSLLERNEPIVSGLYRAKQPQGFNYAAWLDAPPGSKTPNGAPGFVPIESWTGNWLQVATVGFGFCLTQRKVFETLRPPWFPWTSVGPSEDFSFCINARKAGFTINVFTEVKVAHLGTLNVHPDGTITTLEV
jgi:hypothetical protein